MVALCVWRLGGAYLYPCCVVVGAHQSCQQHSVVTQNPWPGLAFQNPCWEVDYTGADARALCVLLKLLFTLFLRS